MESKYLFISKNYTNMNMETTNMFVKMIYDREPHAIINLKHESAKTKHLDINLRLISKELILEIYNIIKERIDILNTPQ